MSANEQSMRRVTAIKNGTVIDHIPSGYSLTVLKMLGIGRVMSNPVSMLMNVPSKNRFQGHDKSRGQRTQSI